MTTGFLPEHVLDQALFLGALIRERKRVDRSERALALVRVHVPAGVPARGSIREGIVAALDAVRRETDILGWFAWPSVVALIMPEIAGGETAEVRERLKDRVRRELIKRLPVDVARKVPIRVHVYPEGKGRRARWSTDPALYPDVRGPETRTADAMKRRLDVLGSLVLLVVLSPLLLLTAMLVKATSRGPVLFRQERVGQMMKPFTMLKFRTMDSAADPDVHHAFICAFINANGSAAANGANGVFKLTNDPRVTALGRFLRKTSLDELPQLWNVLRGDMSLVGPRPPIPYELDQYKLWHRRRVLDAKPGLTGLWQVTGRSRTTFDDMVRLDLRYARTRSLWTDVNILLATPAAAISGKGAC